MQLELFDIEQSIEEDSILCRHCGVVKPRTSFRLYRRATGDRECRSTSCKSCQRRHNEVVEKLRLSAPVKPDSCQCCGKKTDKLVLDHCYETETFRGWICSSCNLAIGSLGDSTSKVQKAMDYLGGSCG
mgnify:CR=1 FL=1